MHLCVCIIYINIFIFVSVCKYSDKFCEVFSKFKSSL